MSIFIYQSSNILVQGVTGGEGKFHTERMISYGANVQAGVTPGKGGREVSGVPVYNSVSAACRDHDLDVSVIFVPAGFARDAILESVGNGIELVVCITEHVPVHDMMTTYQYIRENSSSTLIGPNCPGVISPGKSKAGIMPGAVFKPGKVGVVSRSGTLTYEIASNMTDRGLGQSTVVGIGGDQIVGSNFIDVIDRFEEDPETELIVMVGEIGGSEEEEAARFIEDNISTPVISYIAGFSAPKGKRMGHAGAIISGEEGTAEAKAEVLEDCGIPVGRSPAQVGELALEVSSE